MKKILIIITCLFMTGCWNYRELDEMAIITGIAIDKSDDEYSVSIMVANSQKPESNSKEGESLPTIYQNKGKTLALAAEKLFLQSPKKIYLGHITAVVISDEVAKDGLYNVLDILFRDPTSRKIFYLLISEDTKAHNVLEIVSALEAFPSQDIKTTLSNAMDMQSISSAITYPEFISKLITDGIEPILPTIKIKGDIEKGKSEKSLEQMKPEAVTYLSNTALFKNDKLVGISSENESKGINLLLEQGSRAFVETKCDNNNVIVDIAPTKTNTKVTSKNSISIFFSSYGVIKEVNCDIDLERSKVMEDIEKETEKEVKKILEDAIKKSKELGTDIFGFGDMIYKKYPSYFKKKKNSWNDLYKNLNIDISVDIEIKAKGGLEKVIKEANDE